MSGLSREMIIHPGETLKEVLLDRKMSQQELAVRAGVIPKHISTILSGEKNITVSFAKKLEYALNIGAEFWINLQNAYDKELLEFDEINSISKQELLRAKHFKDIFDYLVRKKIIPACDLAEQKVLGLRKFLNISNLTAIPSLSYTGAFRAQTSVTVDEYVLFAWLRICEVLAESIEVKAFEGTAQKDAVLKSLPALKYCMFQKPDVFVPELQRSLGEYGIAFCIVPHFKGAPVQGFIKHLPTGKIALCMTFRQKRADIFWFSFFHELGHLVNGDTRQKFIDFENVESVQEKKADIFAQNALIDKKCYGAFLRENDFSLPSIRRFSSAQNILPCVVIGRLKKEGHLRWSDYPEENLMYDSYEAGGETI